MKDVMFVDTVMIKFLDSILVIDEKPFYYLKHNDGKIENGGVLYGYKLLGKEEYIITGNTSKQIDDYASECSFIRNSSHHSEVINNLWINDNSIMYLGDWHSHPVDFVQLSSTDKKTFRKICKSCISSSKYLFFVVSAIKEMVIYIYERGNKKLISTSTIFYEKGDEKNEK